MNVGDALRAAAAQTKTIENPEKTPCPKQQKGLLVLVVTEDTKEAVVGAKVDVSRKGATSGSKSWTIGSKGYANCSKNIKKGIHSIKLASLPARFKDGYEIPTKIESVTVTEKGCRSCLIWIAPLAQIKAKVVALDGTEGGTVLDNVQFEISGPQSKEAKSGTDGIAAFEKIKSGEYTVAIKSLAKHKANYAIPEGKKVTLTPGETKEVALQVEPSGWIEFHLCEKVKDKSDPQQKKLKDEPIPGIEIKAKTPGDKTAIQTTKAEGEEKGTARIDKLMDGTVDLISMTSSSGVWEVESIKEE